MLGLLLVNHLGKVLQLVYSPDITDLCLRESYDGDMEGGWGADGEVEGGRAGDEV